MTQVVIGVTYLSIVGSDRRYEVAVTAEDALGTTATSNELVIEKIEYLTISDAETLTTVRRRSWHLRVTYLSSGSDLTAIMSRR